MRDGAEAKNKSAARSKLAALLVLAVAAIAAATLVLTQRSDVAAVRAALVSENAKGPRVEVTTATAGPIEREVRLFSDVRPYQEVTLFGKVSGYLKSVAVDKGTLVKKGQFIAEIGSPETDAQYASAMADLANKKVLAQRAAQLYKIGGTSKEDADQADTNYQVAQAAANQLETLRSYERLVAPFDGRVTARFADPGALVQNATNSQTSALPVVTISDATHLRVDAYLQQQDAPFVHVGDQADITDAANPSRRATARVSRTSGELDPRSHTLLVEIDVPNATDFFVGGSFAYVSLHLSVPPQPQVPVNALVLRDNKQYVAVPDNKNIVHFRSIVVALTDGNVVRIAEGIKVGERIIVNVPDGIEDGDRIQPVPLVARN